MENEPMKKAWDKLMTAYPEIFSNEIISSCKQNEIVQFIKKLPIDYKCYIIQNLSLQRSLYNDRRMDDIIKKVIPNK